MTEITRLQQKLTQQEQEVLGLILDNPGISTLDLADTHRFSFDILLDILKSLMRKGHIYQTEDTQWYSTVEEA